MLEPKRILITGAAGNIGYAIIPLIAGGNMLGPNQPIILHLLETPFCQERLTGVKMEVEDCAFPLVKGLVATTDLAVAFKDVDIAILVGSIPRRDGMERKDLLSKNASIFRDQGQALDQYSKKSVKVLVVGNPANTNCLVAQRCAPSIPKENFTAMTRLDHNRAIALLANKVSVSSSDVQNVIIWGNHSSTQYPDASHAKICGKEISAVISDKAWLQQDFVQTVQQRGAAVIKARGLSSACSAAMAAVCHIHDWIIGTEQGTWVSMAVPSDGSYGIDEGVIFSYPVTCSNGQYKVVQGLTIDEHSRQMLTATHDELKQERSDALSLMSM